MVDNTKDDLIMDLYDAILDFDSQTFIEIVESKELGVKVNKYMVADRGTNKALRNINDETVQDQFKIAQQTITDDDYDGDHEFNSFESSKTQVEKLNEFVETVNEHFGHKFFKLTNRSDLKISY